MLRGILSKLLLLTVVAMPQISSGAAVILFDEDFGALADGTGITGPQPGNISFDGGDWTITAGALDNDGDRSLSASTDYFRVDSGALVARDVDEPVTFLTDVINIPAGFTANSLAYTVTVTETSDLEESGANGDYVDVAIDIDETGFQIFSAFIRGIGDHTLVGDRTLAGESNDEDWGTAVVSQTGLNPLLTVQLRIVILNGSDVEEISLDNIQITADVTPVPEPSAGLLMLLVAGIAHGRVCLQRAQCDKVAVDED